MSYVKILLHCVWSTKNRRPTLTRKDQREALFAHICTTAKAKGIYLLQVGGYTDHLHLLMLLGKNQETAKAIQQIKGEASYWYNRQYPGTKLEWQDDYFALSISHSHQSRVTAYIQNQEEHHRRETFQEEVGKFMTAYGFSRQEDGTFHEDEAP